MKRLLSSGLVFIGGLVSVPAPLSLCEWLQNAPPPDQRTDSRLDVLRAFFQDAGCPAAAYAEAFLEAADDYNLDWRLLPSLSWVESTGGKTARNNNFFGWNSGRTQFPTPAAGIHLVGYQLSHSGLYRSKSLDRLLITYNPDPDYVQLVKSVMRRIAPSWKIGVAP